MKSTKTDNSRPWCSRSDMFEDTFDLFSSIACILKFNSSEQQQQQKTVLLVMYVRFHTP